MTWGGVQPVLSSTTRVCSYDRAGFGWSDPLPTPRDADHVAAELHELLLQAKVTGPIVLMGHSIGGMYERDYATRYPADIVGIVFEDSSTPLQDENPVLKAASGKVPPRWAFELLAKSAMSIGVPRLMGMCSQSIKGSEDPAQAVAASSTDAANVFYGMQEDLKKLSTRSRRIIAKGSSHYIHLDRAELIEKEVPLFIEQIRGTAPQPTNYGSTITE